MQQILFIDLFIDLFKSALHVSSGKLAHLQKHFLTVYIAFGTIHRYCQPTGDLVTGRLAAVSVYCTKSCIHSQKVLLKMGEFAARNMQS